MLFNTMEKQTPKKAIFCLSDFNTYVEHNEFKIQMFGMDKSGLRYSAIISGYKPFFYVLVNDTWTERKRCKFIEQMYAAMGGRGEMPASQFVYKKKLYGFDNYKNHKFIHIEFANTYELNRAKNLWYENEPVRRMVRYEFEECNVELYEDIPPLIRFFHIYDISPSGWIQLNNCINSSREVRCDYSLETTTNNIVSRNDIQDIVPFVIMSTDIEASSSHGDFPLPRKTYMKLACEIIEYMEKYPESASTKPRMNSTLVKLLKSAFCKWSPDWGIISGISEVYIKSPEKYSFDQLDESIRCIPVSETSTSSSDIESIRTLEDYFIKGTETLDKEYDGDCNETEHVELEFSKFNISKNNLLDGVKGKLLVDILFDKTIKREVRLHELNARLTTLLPTVEGDKVTFIGSTFMRYGETSPYLNHCIALGDCSGVAGCDMESYKTERELLMAWKDLVNRINPDIVIGYNVNGFDYQFLFHRAQENRCENEFLKMSRNLDEICANRDKCGNLTIEEKSVILASGQYDQRYIKMIGRIQVDLYAFYRRNENLTSYKLDFVAGHLIGDYISKLEQHETTTTLFTSNLTGLHENGYIHIEQIGNTTEYYNNAKFRVISICQTTKSIVIDGRIFPDTTLKLRWCIAKDDITPKQIFSLTNGSNDDRAIVAKYCVQDCNLVHHLFQKSDILTGFIEMAKISYVPIEYIAMRGQGIKLQSLVAKECRDMDTLMPALQKNITDDGYEGACVLKGKIGLYLEDPCACNDYSGLYPSSMISENLSPDSKTTTREYDLEGNIVAEWGYKDNDGKYLYENIEGLEYIDVEYDTYKYVRKTPTSKAEKVKCGYKTCKFARFEGKRAIFPAILAKLLKARKDTRKMIPGEPDEFRKRILDKRQLGYKEMANSLYGQCGARTSAFYEKDIAACTTAMGRKFLTYGKRIIEECYRNRICATSTQYGSVRTNAEYIYGDTDSVFYRFNLETIDGVPIKGKDALEITIELAQQVGQLAGAFLKPPHDFEYEKTYYPFGLLSKKRYFGMLYEHDINKGKRKEMGVALRRRDNPPKVKDIYGGILQILMVNRSISEAVDFLRKELTALVNHQCPLEKLIISKSLRSGYKRPETIAHKVLADRIMARDPGNVIRPGDRIPYVYVKTSNKKALQADRIECPQYVTDHNVPIDYAFYITNQILNPVQQLFALVLEDLWTLLRKRGQSITYKINIADMKKKTDPGKWEEKIQDIRNKEIKKLLFDEFIMKTSGQQTMDTFLKVCGQLSA